MDAPAAETSPDTLPLSAAIVRWTIVLACAAHVAAAAGWMAFAPGGFPPLHSRTVANHYLPYAVIAAGGGGAIAVLRAPRAWGVPVAALWAGLWWGGAASALALFRESRFLVALACAAPCGGASLLVLGAAAMRSFRPVRGMAVALCAASGALVGGAFPPTQRAEPPATSPGGAVVVVPPDLRETTAARVEVAPGVVLEDDGAVIAGRAEEILIRLDPRLRFQSRSPDRGWALFVPPDVRGRPAEAPTVMRSGDGRALCEGWGLGRWRVDVRARDARRVEVDVEATVGTDVFSHLNDWFEMSLQPAEDLGLGFSPFPEEVLRFERRRGRSGPPARFACLHEDGTFRVHEASRAEKGPFRELARGPLRRGDPLVITVFRHATPRVRVHLLDYASQASVALSPTAGWGIPQNAIEWGRGGTAWLSASLARTSVGRGFDTVGHAAGTYRSRVVVETLGE